MIYYYLLLFILLYKYLVKFANLKNVGWQASESAAGVQRLLNAGANTSFRDKLGIF